MSGPEKTLFLTIDMANNKQLLKEGVQINMWLSRTCGGRRGTWRRVATATRRPS